MSIIFCYLQLKLWPSFAPDTRALTLYLMNKVNREHPILLVCTGLNSAMLGSYYLASLGQPSKGGSLNTKL